MLKSDGSVGGPPKFPDDGFFNKTIKGPQYSRLLDYRRTSRIENLRPRKNVIGIGPLNSGFPDKIVPRKQITQCIVYIGKFMVEGRLLRI